MAANSRERRATQGRKIGMNAEDLASEAAIISIVDDDASVRRSTVRLLGSSGLSAEAFASAADFLQSSRAWATRCLLLDVSMPGMDGLELQRHLTESGRRIPILFISARASEREERLALEAGAAGFLRKPVSKEALLHAIRSALGGHAL
jgi:FixJ family two-component response regulator